MQVKTSAAAFILAAALAGIGISTANAQDVCQDLWIQRNQIYKNHGYCFKTQRAISYFGNAGCRYDYESDVPLSPGERREIANIQAEEARNGCR